MPMAKISTERPLDLKFPREILSDHHVSHESEPHHRFKCTGPILFLSQYVAWKRLVDVVGAGKVKGGVDAAGDEHPQLVRHEAEGCKNNSGKRVIFDLLILMLTHRRLGIAT
jgi:hypothetical protein